MLWRGGRENTTASQSAGTGGVRAVGLVQVCVQAMCKNRHTQLKHTLSLRSYLTAGKGTVGRFWTERPELRGHGEVKGCWTVNLG